MKAILFLLFINSFLFSDFLLVRSTTSNTYYLCIKSYSYESGNLIFTRSSDMITFSTSLSNYPTPVQIKAGYEYENNRCLPTNKKLSDFEINSSSNINYMNLSYLGLSENDLNLMMAFSGIIISFLFLFGLFRWI